jgi:vacuolar-type H+-ATPase subunit E/Vma4
METVKTSEALEAQILEDARGKARRLLEAAQKECAFIRAEADRRDQEEVRRLQGVRDARLAAMRSDLEASVPLDVKRLRLEFFQKSVNKALEDLFASLDSRERARVIGGLVARAASAFINQRLVVGCSGVEPQEARRIIAANVAGAQVQDAAPLAPEEAADAGTGLIVETADRSRRLRATLKELTAQLLEEHREELVKALFGKDVQT